MTSVSLFSQRFIKDINPGSVPTTVQHLGNLKNGFVFWAYTDQYGFEPWISDGTNSGTQIIKDIKTGKSSSWVSDFYYSNDTLLYFTAMDNTENEYLFRTDGTNAGTFKLLKYADHSPATIFNQGIFYKNRFFFIEPRLSGKSTLWSSDGTIAGTRKIFQFNDSGYSNDIRLKEWKGLLYFMAYDHATGLELWTSDGTTQGTKLFKDIFTGTSSGAYHYNQFLASTKNHLFFCAARNFSEGYELFKTTENPDSLSLFLDLDTTFGISTNPYLVEANDSIFVYNLEKAYTSGVTKDTVKEFFSNDPKIHYSNINTIYPFGQGFIVNAQTDFYGNELFSCDRHLNHPVLLKDIDPGSGPGVQYDIHILGNRIYFIGFNSSLLYDIWTSDGTYDGTNIYLEIPRGNAPVMMKWQNHLFFVGNIDESVGDELYELTLNNSSIAHLNNNKSHLYPNPIKAGETLQVSVETSQVALYSQTGKLVWTGQAEAGRCTIPEGLSKGIYYIVIQTKE
ncbi:MAG: T9SS type A sorting domain-containing protein, partial [Chitinophagaceae bacterium]